MNERERTKNRREFKAWRAGIGLTVESFVRCVNEVATNGHQLKFGTVSTSYSIRGSKPHPDSIQHELIQRRFPDCPLVK